MFCNKTLNKEHRDWRLRTERLSVNVSQTRAKPLLHKFLKDLLCSKYRTQVQHCEAFYIFKSKYKFVRSTEKAPFFIFTFFPEVNLEEF